MFAKALNLVSNFTFPVIISKRLANGSIACGCATFIVINKDGWILTAAHVLEQHFLAVKHQAEIAEYQLHEQKILENASLSFQQRKKQLSKLNAKS